MKGKIKWFKADKGYGFIEKEAGGDIFFHISNIEPFDHPKIKDGAEINFSEISTNKGQRAVDISFVQ